VFLVLQRRARRRGPGVPRASSFGSAYTVSPLHSTATLGISPLSVTLARSRKLVRRLPSERDTVVGMRISAYLRPYLFWIVHVIWTARGCVDDLVCMVWSGPRWGFGSTSLLFSGYTLSLPGRVSGEQRGCAAEILSQIGAEHRN